MLEQLKKDIEKDLGKQVISPKIILDRFAILDESGRKSNLYTDFYHLPFYYHLAKRISPKTLLEIGFGVGFSSASFLMGCNSVEKCLFFQDKTEAFYSDRLGRANIKKIYRNDYFIYHGKITDLEWEVRMGADKWDLVFFNEKLSYDNYINAFGAIWEQMSDSGWLVIQNATTNEFCNKAIKDFSKICNRNYIFIETRYGVGIISK